MQAITTGTEPALVFLPHIIREPLSSNIVPLAVLTQPSHPQLAFVCALVYSGRLEIARRCK
jgi:hypothetical protein